METPFTVLKNDASLKSCPICHSPKLRPIFSLNFSRWQTKLSQLGTRSIDQCDNCGHRFMDTTSLSSIALAEQYDNNYSGFRSDAFFQTAIRQELTRNITPRVPPPAVVLDVGCGNGDFLMAATEVGYTALGIDVATAAVIHCQQRGLHAEATDFTGMQQDDYFSLITMWDVVEHLPNPYDFMDQAFRLLQPGGYLLLKIPRVSPFTFWIVMFFPRLASILLHLPGHIHFFSQSTLSSLLKNAGFEQIEWLQDRNMRSRPPIRSLKKAVARLIRALVDQTGKNGNFYVMAQKSYS